MPEVVRTVGRYGILRELGRGGMAVVYLARQVDLDRLVALKELAAFHAADADFARRFVRESRLAGSLVHPNVITVFDFFEHEGTPYIAMEYVERGSLRPYVGVMTLAQIGGVLEGVLAGLGEAELRAIVHRDLKPENLMVTSAGAVKIADFGIAKATQAADTGAFVTATGTTVGTPPYMAPEQAMAKEIGPWTDLYSVGCMAYELFTGRPPFYDAEEPLAILLRHISEPLAPAAEVADVDADISDWIARLTAKAPAERPQSATLAWEDFEEILIGKLGPRWRREARLPEPPRRGAEGGSSSLTTPPDTRTGADSDEYESSAWGSGTPVPGPATPPPDPARPVEGIDVEGTGPDTGGDLPAAETPTAEAAEDSRYETYLPPPSGPTPPPAEPGPPPTEQAPPSAEPAPLPAASEPGAGSDGTPADTDDAAPTVDVPPTETIDEPRYETYLPPPSQPGRGLEEIDAGDAARPAEEPVSETDPPPPPTPPPRTVAAESAPTTLPEAVRPPATRGDVDLQVPERVARLARAGAVALLAALLIPLLTTGFDRWNEFAVLSPFEVVGVALATWVLARALGSGNISVSLAAGALIGFGVLMLTASVALLRFTIHRLDAASIVLAFVVLCGAAAILVAGAGCLRSASSGDAVAGFDPAPLVLGLAGTGLACVAIFVNYDGLSSLWSEIADRESAEFVFEPVVLVAAMLAGLVLLGARPRLAGGLLLAVGTAATLHYLGVIVAAWRAIGEVGQIRAAGFIGVLGGLLVVAAGAWVQRAQAAGRATQRGAGQR